uniref:Uncharacterized protein n=1 Tax=Tanacetum cinerariifolium TaxID=118510 RepID=A0A699I4R7_TANCI|nr:hypothetical protein [Tanacetum cinerariifolium]
MDTTIELQLAMDEALVPTAQRLKIGRSNFRLLSDIKSKESTLKLVYDVLHRCSMFKAFLLVYERLLLPPKQTPPEVNKQSCTSLLLDLLAQKRKYDERNDIINIVSLRMYSSRDTHFNPLKLMKSKRLHQNGNEKPNKFRSVLRQGLDRLLELTLDRLSELTLDRFTKTVRLTDNKKHIIDLESFRDILHICPRVHGQPFTEPSFKEEILAFIRFLRHSAAIRMLTDVIINKLYQPWRSFAALINKCLTGKSSGYDSLRLSQSQIL